MSQRPLTAADIEERLDEPLDPVLSSRRTAAGPARALAAFERDEQDFVLRWVGIIAKTNAEMAYQFAAQAPAALNVMSLEAMESWVIHAMDVYDKLGLYPASAVFRELHAYAADAQRKASGVMLESVSGVLELFVRGLAGRALKLETGDEVYTDTQTLFLPHCLTHFPDPADNFRLYKCIAAHQWAQAWYGTFQVDIAAATAGFPDPDRALKLFHALERIRLDARIARDLPGLHRDMLALRSLRGETPYPPGWEAAVARLEAVDADAGTSAALLAELYAGEQPATLCYQGTLHPERARAAIAARLEREKQLFRSALKQLQDDKDRRSALLEDADAGRDPSQRFKIDQRADDTRPDAFRFALTLDGQPIVPPDDLKGLMGSIVQDLGEIPEEYLVAAGDGGYRKPAEDRNPEDVWKGTYHEEGAFLYNEWDYRRKHYRKHWCVLREIDVHPVDEPFVARTRRKYSGLISQLRKTFETLRGEEKLLKKQIHGDNIDFDALVEAYADMRQGREMSERVLTKLHKLERNIAVMFMVDMSGSTKGWINDAEREALVMLCEALEVLGDRYAIYGFSGITRKRCELYRVKRFDDPIPTRCAPASPASSRRTTRAWAPHPPPDDAAQTGRGPHQAAHHPVRRQARRLRRLPRRLRHRGHPPGADRGQARGHPPVLHHHRPEARDYLPHMYGPVNYAVIDDVRSMKSIT
jgi:nitric oxide reductase NorD protein